MAAPANTQTTFGTTGNREDITDFIYNISPTATPFMSGIPTTKATNVLHQWQTDALDTVSRSNFVLEGDDATVDAHTSTTMLSNATCISDKVASVSGTQQAVITAGRRDELAYQIVKKSKSLKRDMEAISLANNIVVTAGDTNDARETGGIESWITTNTSAGAGGSDGSLGTTARTAGTNRDFTEAQLKTVLKGCFDQGGDPDCIMVDPFNKQTMSTFTGNATRFTGAEDRELYAAIDVYNSDFGDLEVIPNRFVDTVTDVGGVALVLEKELWAFAYLRPIQISELSKTGDSEKRQILAEYALESRNEAASGAVWDLTLS